MDFYFDYSCPYAYLAFTQLERLEAASGRAVTLKPMLLGGVFAARGTPQNLMGSLGPAKAKHNLLDMQRWASAWGVPLAVPAEHPRRTVEALRATLIARCDRRVVAGFYRAYWEEGRAPSDPETIRDVVARAGLDPEHVLARIGEESTKQALRAATDEAVERGVFGAPTIVDDDGALYWGQDRLFFVFGDAGALPVPAPRAAGRTLDFYWDFSSPYAYLASTQVEALAARTGARLVSRPMLLGAVFKSIGQAGVPIQSFSDAKRDYILEDLHRWAARCGVPFRFPSRFPLSSVKALRIYLALPEARRAAFRAATYRAAWAEDRDVSDDGVLREILGSDADEWIARTQDPDVKQALFDATERALSAGVFGAPAYVVDERDLYWGQDRAALVERALLA